MMYEPEKSFRLLRGLGVRMLMIDEINSILVGSARQQRQFLQLLRFLSNELQVAIVCAGVPEARFALLSDPQLRSRVAEVALEPWTAGPALQDFINKLVQSLPLRQPSPVDSLALRRLLIERSGGITLSMCRAIQRAGVALLAAVTFLAAETGTRLCGITWDRRLLLLSRSI